MENEEQHKYLAILQRGRKNKTKYIPTKEHQIADNMNKWNLY